MMRDATVIKQDRQLRTLSILFNHRSVRFGRFLVKSFLLLLVYWQT